MSYVVLARQAACALNVLPREGLADLFGSTDGPALMAFVNEFFGGDNPASYDSPGNLMILVSTQPS